MKLIDGLPGAGPKGSPGLPTRGGARRFRSWRPAALILLAGVGGIIYLQTIGVVDRGTSNISTAIVVGVTLLALAAWTAFLSPLARNARWWFVAVAAGVVATLFGTIKIEGFNGNLVPKFVWRWTPKPDVALAERGFTPVITGQLDLTPTADDFPGFLGANRDGYVPHVQLATDWQARPPKLLWKQPIGAGWSGFSIVGGAAFTLEQRGEQELITCYDIATGELLWADAIVARHSNDIGGDGPGSTPTVLDGRVYVLGGTGVLRCLDGASGRRIWMRDVLADVGTKYEIDRTAIPWGRAASPLVVDDLVIVPGGGPPSEEKKTSLVAYHKRTGDKVWEGGAEQVSYSSPSLATYGGVRQVIIVNEDTISSHEPATGRELWQTKWDGSSSTSASAPQTIQVSDDRLFVSKGYSVGGAALFEVRLSTDGTWQVSKLYHNRRVLKTKLNNVVTKDGFAYGLSDGLLQCVEIATGEQRWEGNDYGHGQVLRVGNLLLVMQEQGAVALVAMQPEAFQELARFQAIEGKTWNNPALAGKLLLVRNAIGAACYELPLAE